jgi:hypothetical protein
MSDAPSASSSSSPPSLSGAVAAEEAVLPASEAPASPVKAEEKGKEEAALNSGQRDGSASRPSIAFSAVAQHQTR